MHAGQWHSALFKLYNLPAYFSSTLFHHNTGLPAHGFHPGGLPG